MVIDKSIKDRVCTHKKHFTNQTIECTFPTLRGSVKSEIMLTCSILRDIYRVYNIQFSTNPI